MTLETLTPPVLATPTSSRRRRLVVGCAVAAVGVTGVGVMAAPSHAASVPQPVGAGTAVPVLTRDDRSAQQALRLLTRAVKACRTTAYTGVQYVTAWDRDGATSVVADVSHLPGLGAVVNVRETADGRGERVLDSDEPGVTGLPSPSEAEMRLLAEHYILNVDGRESVDARPADVVAVRRPDGSLAARFWLDRATGLVLRRELLDQNGRMMRSSVFVDLRLQPDLKAAALPTTPIPLPWSGRVEPAKAVAALVPRGYHVPMQLASGFTLFDARLGSTPSGRVLHLSYSDGLNAVSVFEQRGRLDASRLVGWHRQDLGGRSVWAHGGMPARFTWSTGGTVYTVLSDAPVPSVSSVVSALPRNGHHRSILGRVLPGLARIGSWLNPFA
jgi:sigma-E factor negative regulatory protein RseB